MLATYLCFIRMLVMFGDTLIGGDTAPIQGLSMILDPPLPIIAMSPPNCLEERAGRPNGPPDYCLYILENRTLISPGVLLVSNYTNFTGTPSSPHDTSQPPPVSFELFVVLNDSLSPVDVGLRGSGRTTFQVDLPNGGKLEWSLEIPPFSRIGRDRLQNNVALLDMRTMMHLKVNIPGLDEVSSSNRRRFVGYVGVNGRPGRFIRYPGSLDAISTNVSASVQLDVFVYDRDGPEWGFIARTSYVVSGYVNGSGSFNYAGEKELVDERIPDSSGQ
ncbi:hypothetical protein FOZ63_025876 [Perkinsus olseni]|uniref:Uncharacterized protein n=1 Tax=Perkinsus olseni TaxID=32597 RepID=A0A7J6R5A0_PEROL|nr:hypothetical protein FOZ63_025876 [Perkinsus olseni]